MEYEELDKDTQAIIECMCDITGKTKPQAILALVECGMLAMMAAVQPDKSTLIMDKVFDCINNDAKMKETAQAYAGIWCM